MRPLFRRKITLPNVNPIPGGRTKIFTLVKIPHIHHGHLIQATDGEACFCAPFMYTTHKCTIYMPHFCILLTSLLLCHVLFYSSKVYNYAPSLQTTYKTTSKPHLCLLLSSILLCSISVHYRKTSNLSRGLN